VAALGGAVAYLVVRPDCPLEGLAGPRLKYVPFSSLYDVVAAAQCGRLELHVPGVGRFSLGRDLTAAPRRLLMDAEEGWIVGRPAAPLLKRVVYMRADRRGVYVRGHIAAVDVARFKYGVGVNLRVGDFLF